MLVKEADQPPEFEQAVLERGGRQQNLRTPLDGGLDGRGDAVGRLEDVPEAVSLVHDHKVPLDGSDRLLLGSREVVRANGDPVGRVERIWRTAFLAGGVGPPIEDL
jgi:hypothetical protein